MTWENSAVAVHQPAGESLVYGATTVACLSAWPASMTDRASRLPQDRQSHLFDL